jgi:hypothetical protein
LRFLILAHIGDETALRVYSRLRTRHGNEHVKLVSVEEIALAPYWAHRQEGSRVTTEVRLADGTLLDSEKIGTVFNRLLMLTLPQFARAKEADREYAVQEMNALCLSWLASLPCPVVNAPTPTGLGGAERSHAEWLSLAGQAGLPVQGYHFTTDPRWHQEKGYVPHRWRFDSPKHEFEKVSASPTRRLPTFYLEPVLEPRESVVVAGENVFGNPSVPYGEQFKNLTKLSGCDVLQVEFALRPAPRTDQMGEGSWIACRVDPFPHIHSARAIEAVVEMLENKRAGYQPDVAVRR